MVDIMASPSAELSKGDEYEDGELPEEGEIQDEDEPVAPAPSQPSPPPAVSPQRLSQTKKPAPRGYGDDLEVSQRNIWGPPEGNVDYNGAPGGEDRDYRLNNDEGDFGDMDFRQGPMSRRRKMSPTMDDFDGPRGGPRGRPWRGGFKKPKWATEHQICKFFREGYCRDGDQCTYSHQAEDSLRKPELCRFYSNGYCKKGLTCLSLHGEFPCLPFHKGECTMEHCRFSHLPLNEYTRPLYEQRLKDEEMGLTGRNPHFPPGGHHAARRRVLLPHGPDVSGPMCHQHNPHPPAIHAPIPPASNGQLPPPAVVVPTIANNGPPHPPYPQMPPRGSFFPAPASVHQPSPHRMEEPQPIAPTVAPAFDISSMLAKIAGENIVDDSPASPPLFGETSLEPVRSIPEVKEISWRLVPVDAARAYAGIDSNNLPSNDPRISKIIASQFDAVSNMFATTEDPRIRDPRRRPDEKRPSDDRPRVSSWMPQLA